MNRQQVACREDICKAIADRRPFNSETVAVAIPHARRSRIPHLQPRAHLPRRVASPSTPTPLQTEAAQEEGDNPGNERFVEVVSKPAARAPGLMANKYERRHEVAEFEADDYCNHSGS